MDYQKDGFQSIKIILNNWKYPTHIGWWSFSLVSSFCDKVSFCSSHLLNFTEKSVMKYPQWNFYLWVIRIINEYMRPNKRRIFSIDQPRNSPNAPPVSDKNELLGYVDVSSRMMLAFSDNRIIAEWSDISSVRASWDLSSFWWSSFTFKYWIHYYSVAWYNLYLG